MMSNDGDAIVDDDAKFSLGVFRTVQDGAQPHLFRYIVNVRIRAPRRCLDLLLITDLLIRVLDFLFEEVCQICHLSPRVLRLG